MKKKLPMGEYLARLNEGTLEPYGTPLPPKEKKKPGPKPKVDRPKGTATFRCPDGHTYQVVSKRDYMVCPHERCKKRSSRIVEE